MTQIPRFGLLLVLMCSMFPLCMYGEECTSKQLPDSTLELSGNWFNQLSQCNFRINDPRIKYPRFVNFCRTVYNWGDTTFNRYDSAYVIGTGQNWKLYANSYNWHQSYAFIFHDQPVILHSKINSDLGISLNFMAVSIGYTWNVNRLITGKQDQRRIFNFSFTCALFSAEITSWNTYGDTKLTKFGNYKNVDGSNPDIPIDNMNHKAFNLNAYYFFNHNKYSQAAAYNFSKYQLKSAGSWILGINYGRHTIAMDFEHLPPSMTDDIPDFASKYDFSYTDYTILGGYGYSHVLPHNWLYNVTILPSVGYKRTEMTNTDVKKDNDFNNTISLNYQGKMSMTYNHRSLFVSATIRLDGNCYFDESYTFFNTRCSASAIVGVRF